MSCAGEFDHALALHRAGRSAEASALCEAILARSPEDARALHLLGAIRFAGGRTAEAIGLVTRALAAKSDYAEAEFNLGAMLAATGQTADAADHYGRAAALQPAHVEAQARLAATLMNLRRYAESEEAYRRVLALQPDHRAAHTDMAALALIRGDLDAAESHGRAAVALAPRDPMAALRLGRALDESGQPGEAIRHYRRAIQLDPQDVAYRRNLVRTMLYSSEFSDADRKAEHLSFAAAMAARVPQKLPPPRNDGDPKRRLRVGWLSSDLYQHPVGRNLEPLFAARDAAQFEFICYAEVETPDEMTEWFRTRADAWRSTVGLSDAEVAGQIRADRIDVMIYVGGRFDKNRPQVAAWRPAPVQVSLFDAATSGLADMDYFIANRFMVPRSASEYFSERLLCLPNFYLHRAIAGGPQAGPLPQISAGRVTFACFNNPAKIGAPVLALWRRILERLPEARLVLKFQRKYASERLRARVVDAIGPVAARVEFDPVQRALGEHLGLYNQTDIALDPFPFTGSTTTFEALWMGVPVISLAGSTFMGRWTAFMLHAVKLDELIARSADEYVEIAARLAADPAALATLRAGLRERVLRSPICDERRTVRFFERALRAVWRRWCRSAGRP
ncbi:MAG TPA: tetratricopeptide repeat protein [Alphaproteobacteria bacterium]|nr:tetratricopeptide repeat protein [Alphaproteobacteria bacterium]